MLKSNFYMIKTVLSTLYGQVNSGQKVNWSGSHGYKTMLLSFVNSPAGSGVSDERVTPNELQELYNDVLQLCGWLSDNHQHINGLTLVSPHIYHRNDPPSRYDGILFGLLNFVSRFFAAGQNNVPQYDGVISGVLADWVRSTVDVAEEEEKNLDDFQRSRRLWLISQLYTKHKIRSPLVDFDYKRTYFDVLQPLFSSKDIDLLAQTIVPVSYVNHGIAHSGGRNFAIAAPQLLAAKENANHSRWLDHTRESLRNEQAFIDLAFLFKSISQDSLLWDDFDCMIYTPQNRMRKLEMLVDQSLSLKLKAPEVAVLFQWSLWLFTVLVCRSFDSNESSWGQSLIISEKYSGTGEAVTVHNGLQSMVQRATLESFWMLDNVVQYFSQYLCKVELNQQRVADVSQALLVWGTVVWGDNVPNTIKNSRMVFMDLLLKIFADLAKEPLRILAACNTFKTLSVLILKKLDLQSNPHLLLSIYSHVRMINALDNIVFASGMGVDEKIGYLCRVNQLLLDCQAYHVLDYLLVRCCNYQPPALSSPNLGAVLEQMMFPAPASYQMKRSPITHLFLLRFMVEQAVNTHAISDEQMLTKMRQIRKWSDSHLLSLLRKIAEYRSGRDQVVRLREHLPRELVRVKSDTDEFKDVSNAAKLSDGFLQNIGVLTWLKHFERVNAPASNQSLRLSY